MTISRERFCAVLAHAPLLRGDAIIVLAGEDGEGRADVALELFKQRAAPVIVCAGKRSEPPHILNGEAISVRLLSAGIAPSCLLVEGASMNTREQATNVIEMAVLNDWHRLLLVMSPYHAPRAFLTFLRALQQVEQAEKIHLVSVPAGQLRWFEPPPGASDSRLALFARELDKIDSYGAPESLNATAASVSDVASYAEGLAYLKYWEGR